MLFGIPVWVWLVVVMIVGIGIGLGLFPWFGSPFGPSLWKANPMFARVFHTIAQVIRGQGVLVKRASNEYEIGQYDPERKQVRLSDGWLDVDPEKTRWRLFGKRPFAVTWEPGTDLHQRVQRPDADSPLGIDMGAVHRYLRGTNEEAAINRTKEQAEAEYAGGADTLSDLTMAVLTGFMAVLGFLMTWVVV